MLRLPTRVLILLAGGSIKNLVAKNLTSLESPSLHVLVQPSDLVISGKPTDVAHARALLADKLAFSQAHLT